LWNELKRPFQNWSFFPDYGVQGCGYGENEMTSTIVANGSSLTLSGIIPFNTIEVQGATSDTDLILTANATLNNSGTIRLDGMDSRIRGNTNSPMVLDNVNGTIEGSGQIGVNNGGLQLGLVNEAAGTIDANASAALALGLLGSPAALNAGLIEATGTSELDIQNASHEHYRLRSGNDRSVRDERGGVAAERRHCRRQAGEQRWRRDRGRQQHQQQYAGRQHDADHDHDR
jgi:hypothetical protein